MAFAGIFFNQIRNVIDIKSNVTTSAEQLAKLFNNDDIIISSISTSSSSSESFTIRPTSNVNRNEYAETNYRGVLDSDLTSLTTAQRNAFIVTLTVLFVLALCGNVCTLFVNFRRKIRPFFRACLISLAFSDLMNTVFLTASYLSQFTADFVQIWSLGSLMCSMVPFATTCAILASSMTLVGIALDRYFAVMKVVIGFWNPSVISCVGCTLCIWLAAISIACPAFTFYDTIPVYILTEEHETAHATKWAQIITAATTPAGAAMSATASSLLPAETGSLRSMPKKSNITFTANLMRSSVTTIKSVTAARMATETNAPSSSETSLDKFLRKRKLVSMCISDQKNVSVYYIIVFAIIFVPCIVAFFWFNTVIARKLWERRHLAGVTIQTNCKTKTSTMTNRPPSSTELAHIEQPRSVLIQNKSIRMSSSSTSPPSSMSSTLCGKLKSTASAHTNNTSSNGAKVTTNNGREARHLRMFTIILLMMAVFVFLRLPAWIFLLMRLYGNYSTSRCWILYFIFGLMNLGSSVLNPLFYTFLTEAVKYFLKLKVKVASLRCVRGLQSSCCFYCGKNNLAAGRCTSVLCQLQFSARPDHKYIVQTHSLQREAHSKDCMPPISNENDEGVDCNDEVDEENVCSVNYYNQRIYTIFPSSLVSSAINSENQ